MPHKFIYDTRRFRARCISVESPEHVLLNVDIGFKGRRIIPFKIHGVKNTKEEAIDFLWDILDVEDADSDWPLSIQTYIDPKDNDNYLVKISVEDYSKGVRDVICVNDLMVQRGFSQYRNY